MALKAKAKDSGKLKIGDDWNAIRIIALSQSNPLKAIAEFVENSIDAHAKPSPSRVARSRARITLPSKTMAMACPAMTMASRTSNMSRPIFVIRSSGG